jgi:hypothetical protein
MANGFELWEPGHAKVFGILVYSEMHALFEFHTLRVFSGEKRNPAEA